MDAKGLKVALVRADLAEREVASETPAPLEQQVFAGSLVLLVFKALPVWLARLASPEPRAQSV